MSNLFHRVSRTVRTIRHLKPVQISNRVWRRIKPIALAIEAPSVSVRLKAQLVPFVHRAPSIIGQSDFFFLNERRSLSYPEGWNDPSTSKLWLYNLHYFEGILCLETPQDLKQAIIEKWIEDNPPGYGTGWEPYPISLRIVNWIKWSLSGGNLSLHAKKSLALQARCLSGYLEYHLLGNHLFANAKALVFAGCFFQGQEARQWLKKGLKILRKQIPEQFLADGAHFELSTTYHALLTEDLLDIIHILRTASLPVPSEWEKTAQRALIWLHVMTRPDGLLPLFNDAAYGITPTFGQLMAYASQLGFDRPQPISAGMHDLPDCGYFRYEGRNYSLFGDIGSIGPDYIPGHGHCDMLNFELYAHGRPVVVDTGTSTYEVGSLRATERSTAAHNTVQVDSLEQSEIWAAFRVGRRARIVERQVSEGLAIGAHDGFKRSAGVIHRRSFYCAPGNITIADQLTGKAGHSAAVARIHFHPDSAPQLIANGIEAGGMRFNLTNATNIRLEDYNYAPEFNKRIPAKVVVISFNNTLQCNITI